MLKNWEGTNRTLYVFSKYTLSALVLAYVWYFGLICCSLVQFVFDLAVPETFVIAPPNHGLCILHWKILMNLLKLTRLVLVRVEALRPSQHFSVMSGRSHSFLGITSTFGR